MIVRWQCGSWGGAAFSYAWQSLNVSIDLMRKLFPDATFHVNWQGQFNGPPRPGVQYHKQNGADYEPASMGKLDPKRFDINDYELWLDNDHLMWAIPQAVTDWLASPDGVLMWNINRGYYGSFSARCPLGGTSGFFGLPPNSPDWPPYEHPVPKGGNCDQEEMGYVATYLGQFEHKFWVYEGKEFTLYSPGSEGWPAQLEWGTCGIHLSGINRGNWDPTALLSEVRSKFL